MTPTFSSDGAARINWNFRTDVNNVPFTLTFKDSAGAAYSFVYDDFQVIIKKNKGDKKNVLVMGFGSGLTLASNVLTIDLNRVRAKLPPDDYYWYLYKNDYGRVWIDGVATGYDGLMPVIDESTTVTINDGGTDITVTIAEATPNIIQATTGGHTIKSAGSAQTQRAGLNFTSDFTISDDSVNDETDVSITAALATKRTVGARQNVTLANGVTTINWAAGSIQSLTISEAKVITTISNAVTDEVITLIIPGTNSLTFSGLDATIIGDYVAAEENVIRIHYKGNSEYSISYENSESNTGGSGASVEAFAALTEAAPVAWAVTQAFSNKTLSLTADRTLGTPSGVSSGYQGLLIATASGAQRVLTLPAGTSHVLYNVGDSTIKTITIPSGKRILLSWVYDGTNFHYTYSTE
jgi:hypothetical protein